MNKVPHGHIGKLWWMWLPPTCYIDWLEAPGDWFLAISSDTESFWIRMFGLELCWKKKFK